MYDMCCEGKHRFVGTDTFVLIEERERGIDEERDSESARESMWCCLSGENVMIGCERAHSHECSLSEMLR